MTTTRTNAQPAADVHCPSCGGPNRNAARVCAFCGMLLAPSVAAARPAELAAALPSSFGALRSTGCALLIIGSVFTAFALVMMIVATSSILGQWQRDSREASALAAASRDTTATVVEHRVVVDSDGPDDYYVKYRYDASLRGDRRVLTRESKISSADYERWPVGTRIKVRYAVNEPTIARPLGYLPQPNALGSFGLVLGVNVFLLIFVAVGSWLIRGGFKSMRQARRLASEGQRVSGTVVTLEQGKDSDGDPTYHVGYRFEPLSGSAVVASQSVSRTTFERLSQGDNLTVLYLPDEPQTAVLLGL